MSGNIQQIGLGASNTRIETVTEQSDNFFLPMMGLTQQGLSPENSKNIRPVLKK